MGNPPHQDDKHESLEQDVHNFSLGQLSECTLNSSIAQPGAFPYTHLSESVVGAGHRALFTNIELLTA